MAYGNAAVGTDGARGIHARDVKDDVTHNAEGAIDVSSGFGTGLNGTKFAADSFGVEAASHPLNQHVPEQPFQASAAGAYPTSNLNSQYPFQNDGEPGYLGQDMDDYGPNDPRAVGDDPQRPRLPGPVLQGASGSTNAGDQGVPVDFDAVAPYEYGEFGDPFPGEMKPKMPPAAVPLT